MCGIVAIISKTGTGFYATDLDIFENLLLIDQIRGDDSTGAFCVNRTNDVELIKVASHPSHLFRSTGWRNFRSDAIQQGRILVGHNRKATQGVVSSENAHPFVENNIILVHNGTLYNHKHLGDQEVDSHAIAHALSKGNVEEIIPKLNGAFALIWWDNKEKKLFVTRNSDRPLYMVDTKEHWYLASEPWMPENLIKRASRKIDGVYTIEEDKLYDFGLKGVYSSKKLPVKQALYVTKESIEEGPEIRTELHNFNPQDFPIKSEVVIQINKFHQYTDGQRVKGTGKVVLYKKPSVDVNCLMPEEFDMADGTEWAKKKILAEVVAYHNHVCGPTLHVNNLQVMEDLSTNNDPIIQVEWETIVDTGTCDTCGKQIFEEDREFTTVTCKPDNKHRIICADCVEDKLPKGKHRDEFVQHRLNALQDTKPVSKEPSSNVILLPGQSSSSSLH